MPTLRAARFTRASRIAFALALSAFACPGFVRAQSPPPARPNQPTLAVEDTMRTEVAPVLVDAPRVTLDEILDRVARGEARRDSLLKDVVFTATMRVITNVVETRKPPVRMMESVARVYRKKPAQVRSVSLRKWHDKKLKDDDVSISFGADTDEDIVNFAFKPEARRDYRYHIVGRELLGNHLIYKIAFEPRSLIGDPEPSGVVWVDTRDFVIVRQELSFDRSPVPIMLKGIDRMVVERQHVGEFWVLKRVLLRVRMTIPVPKVGRSFDIAMAYSDYAVNQGIDDSIFPKVAK